MQTTLIYGVWDELTKSWCLCEYSENKYSEAQAIATHLNKQHNKKKKVEFKRYIVKAKEADQIEANKSRTPTTSD